MYIEDKGGYYDSHGQQHSRKGWFLMLMHPEHHWSEREKRKDYFTETRALVRKVALSQCGHWMMGTARAFGHSLTVSGAYGADGLIMNVPEEVYEKAYPVPERLMRLSNDGGGWNSAGSEADEMRKWALENLDKLTPKK